MLDENFSMYLLYAEALEINCTDNYNTKCTTELDIGRTGTMSWISLTDHIIYKYHIDYFQPKTQEHEND